MMSKWMRFILCLGLISGYLAVKPQMAWACSCAAFLTPEEEMTHSTAVFTGKVLEVHTPRFVDVENLEPVRVTFQVYSVWKGPELDRTVAFTSGGSASCGYAFIEGKEYLVYADGTLEQLKVYSCSRTVEIPLAGDDLAALGPGVAPAAGGADFLFVPIIVLGGIGLVSILTILRRVNAHYKLTSKGG